MAFWNSVKGFFKKFGGLFRSGLKKFLSDRFDEALAIAEKLYREGQFATAHAFAQVLWLELRQRFSKEPGTWLTIIAGYVCDALKAKGKLNF